MSFRSAQDDFESRTLSVLPGLLSRLCYLGELHDGRGGYSHWGMSRVHGSETARRAIRSAHANMLTSVLRTPLKDLIRDLADSAAASSLSCEELLLSMEHHFERLLPHAPTAASQKHFKAVLHALSALLQNQALAIHPGASRPLRPVQ